jgi:hypothetical protein
MVVLGLVKEHLVEVAAVDEVDMVVLPLVLVQQTKDLAQLHYPITEHIKKLVVRVLDKQTPQEQEAETEYHHP